MYRNIKLAFSLLLIMVLPLFSFAQDHKLPNRLEIVEVENDEEDVQIEVFALLRDGQKSYYLSVGDLGVGNKVVQLHIDPIFELFIPLGNTLDEAQENLEKMKTMFKQSKGDTMQVTGCLDLAFPGENLETVTITYTRFMLTHMLEFSVQREGYLRATHITRSQFKSLVTSLKLYRKLHPKEI